LHPDDRVVPGRPSVTVTRLAAMGTPASALIGVRHALERRSGWSTVPIGSALLGTVMAVIALCGTVVFGSSLAHLTATPRLYGDAFQLNFTDINIGGAVGTPAAGLLGLLRADKDVTGITRGLAIQVDVDHVGVGSGSRDGRPRSAFVPDCQRPPSEFAWGARPRFHDHARGRRPRRLDGESHCRAAIRR
jgi:hypothetical protein